MSLDASKFGLNDSFRSSNYVYPQIFNIEIESEVVGSGGPEPTVQVFGYILYYELW